MRPRFSAVTQRGVDCFLEEILGTQSINLLTVNTDLAGGREVENPRAKAASDRAAHNGAIWSLNGVAERTIALAGGLASLIDVNSTLVYQIPNTKNHWAQGCGVSSS